MIDLGRLLRALAERDVRLIIVGGMAGIALKRAAGRPKDLEAIAELESLRDERS